MNHLDIISNLLAQENIEIERSSRFPTASFDTENRILCLPILENADFSVEEMFVMHEVSHAIFTDHEKWIDGIENSGIPKSYFNIVEDARIERLMKLKYPGSKKSFFQGYKNFYDNDLMEIQSMNPITMNLIDRLNLFFKFGLFIDVSFDDNEKIFIDKILATQSIDDALSVAKEIYEYSKVNDTVHENGLNQSDTGNEVEIEDSDESDGDCSEMSGMDLSDNDKEKSDEKDDSTKDIFDDFNQDDEKDLESKTESLYSDAMNSLKSENGSHIYFDINIDPSYDPIYSYKEILSDFTEIFDSSKFDKDEYDSFMTQSKRIVNYLAKEFEMKKSARGYKHAKISTTGLLNSNRLSQYKISDDLFKKMMVIPNEKGHGMIFLLDWSGSMINVIKETIKQMVNLVMFCRQVNIPFEVFAFSNGDLYYERGRKIDSIKNYVYSTNNYRLLNFFSSKMTTSEFNMMTKYIVGNIDLSTITRGKYTLCQTPLNDSLLFMMDYIGKYMKNNSIEKFSLITLTDGASNPIKFNYVNRATQSSDKFFFNDPVTKKSYNCQRLNNSNITQLFIGIIKDRYPMINVIGFHIIERPSKIKKGYMDNLGAKYDFSGYDFDSITDDIRKNRYHIGKNDARDILFYIVMDKSSGISDEEIIIGKTDRPSSIAKKFNTMLSNKKHSRVILDKFSELVF